MTVAQSDPRPGRADPEPDAARSVVLKAPGGLDRLTLASASARAPAAGEITVRIRAGSLNWHDYFVANGRAGLAEDRIPLSDAAGDVVAVGEGVRDFKVGDPVVSVFFPRWQEGDATASRMKQVPGDTVDGFARDLVTMAETAFTRAPAGYSAVEAATLPCAALTAWRALVVNGGLRPGDSVLLQGTGGVSIFALQFAKAAGATVIAMSSSDEKLDRLSALGADRVLNYRTNGDWGPLVRSMTGGRGVDHVVEVGGAETLNRSIAATRVGGHIALIGVLSGHAGPVKTASIMAFQLRVVGVGVGSRADQIRMIRAIEATGIRPQIDSVFDLADIGAAFAHLEAGRHFGKVCVSMDGSGVRAPAPHSGGRER